MSHEASFVLLFAIASLVAMIAKRLRLPYTVALVVAGLLLGFGAPFEAPHLTQELLYAVFLPGLLFEAAYHLELRQFLENKVAIVTLAAPGVLVGIGVTALLMVGLVGTFALEVHFSWIDALVFGGLVAATDPIAVVSLFKSLGAPKRLGVLVEGESLLNDGTAVVVFSIILAAANGAEATVGGAIVEFVKTVGVGILVGAGVGYGVSKAIQRVDDALIEMTLTTVAAWGSFVLAEELHVSGVMATVVAGLICGNYGAATGMSPSTRVAIATFWEYVAFALNSLVFLLIGFEIDLQQLAASWLPIVLAWVVVMVARFVVVGGVAALLRRTNERIPWVWTAVLTWGGLRGGLSMVLVLGLPASFAHRAFLLNTTFGVVLISILVQGTTMGPLLRRLGVIVARGTRLRFEAARTASSAARAALAEIDVLEQHGATASTLEPLRVTYRDRIAKAETEMRDAHGADLDIAAEERRRHLRHLLLVEKSQVLADVHEGMLSAESAAALLSDIDARLLASEEAHATPETPETPETPATTPTTPTTPA